MKKIFCFMAAAFVAAVLSACNHGGELSTRAGAFIQDGLPSTAQLWKAEMNDPSSRAHVPGTENTENFQLDWNVYDSPVPCSAIKAVHYWASGIDKDEAGLRLRGHQYGGDYFPRPASGITWLAPELWVEPITKTEAEKLALHCGVDFVERRG